MSVAKRSAVMARIRGSGTGPELLLAAELRMLGLGWEEHARDLPGRPDFVFRDRLVAVFVDGDFWHGYQFSTWRDKLSVAWEAKIAETIRRDKRNRTTLRKAGWAVVRVWEHQVKARPKASAKRVLRALQRDAKS